MRSVRIMLILLFAVAIALSAATSAKLRAAPPLTDLQRATLHDATTDDDADLVQQGLYALLRNARDWPPADERGAAVPDYDALYAHPAEHRGEVVLIEGTLIRAGSRRLDRQGPWGGLAVEWVVRVSEDPEDAVVVLMPGRDAITEETHPAASIETPRRVRLPARFYKVWRIENAGNAGGVGRFLVFVGPSRDFAPAPSTIDWLRPVLITALVLLALGILTVLRKAIAPRPRPLQRQRREREAADTDDAHVESSTDPPRLPEDPADAMAAMLGDEGPDGQGAEGLKHTPSNRSVSDEPRP